MRCGCLDNNADSRAVQDAENRLAEVEAGFVGGRSLGAPAIRRDGIARRSEAGRLHTSRMETNDVGLISIDRNESTRRVSQARLHPHRSAPGFVPETSAYADGDAPSVGGRGPGSVGNGAGGQFR